MAINKVILNNSDGTTNTLIDLTSDTVTAATMLNGTLAHDKSGTLIEGTHTCPTFTTEEKTITPNESVQYVTPTSANGLSKVTINAISNTYVGSGIVRRTGTDLTANGATVTVPSGYYASQQTKSVSTTTHPKPTVDINSTGLITASHIQSSGYVTGGTTTGTKQLTVQAAKTITPTKAEQTAVNSGVYTTGIIKVGAIPNEYIVPSGSETLVENKTYDVTNLSSVTVALPFISVYNGSTDPSSSLGSNGDIYLKLV